MSIAAPLADRVREWIADDPDADARAELTGLLDAGDDDELRARFDGELHFGTAGLRGPLGAGPTRINQATVRRASAGLAAWLNERRTRTAAGVAHSPAVVIGHDARHDSARLAAEAAAVFAGAGLRALHIEPLTPTPVLAYAVLHHGCAAGVMITASHNPATDNGYKVYASHGAQIVAPDDADISECIDAVGPLSQVALGDPQPLGDETRRAYVDEIVPAALALAPPEREVAIVYTPVHGVGGETMVQALAAAGFPAPSLVAAQFEPDPDFPTAPKPNPEEPGVLDLALAQARDEHADVVLATDPDADRLAVAIPWEGGDRITGDGAGGWRRLTGDEVGALLADRLLGLDEGDDGAPAPASANAHALAATTIVSAGLLREQAAAAGAPYAETLTGFKWIMAAERDRPADRLRFGYEQALGYAVTALVKDKDGISAGLLMAALAARARATGTTLAARLDAIAERFGLYATVESSIDLTGTGGAQRAQHALRALHDDPPATLLGEPVTAIDDLRTGMRRDAGGRRTALGLAPSEGVVVHAERLRIAVRPSGTEPKLKVYLQTIVAVEPGGAHDARGRAARELDALSAEARRMMDR